VPTTEPITTTVECDPSYPDFCIPPAPPDLDCEDVDGELFTVLEPDPHELDGDGDGIGCEGPPPQLAGDDAVPDTLPRRPPMHGTVPASDDE
jgi:hypothetical protein